MSRKKKPVEERLLDLVEEAGLETVKSSLRTIELLWRKTPDVALESISDPKSTQTTTRLTKAQKQTLSVKNSDTSGSGTSYATPKTIESGPTNTIPPGKTVVFGGQP